MPNAEQQSEHLCVEGQMGKRGLREGGKKNLRRILNYLNTVSYKKTTEKRVNRRRKTVKEPVLGSAFCPCGTASFGALL